jgi:hypothetical protein
MALPEAGPGWHFAVWFGKGGGVPSCPFNSKAYLSGLAHLGSAQARAGAPFPVLKRAIQRTPYRDGLGAWPYVFVGRDVDLAALPQAFSDLITLTLVTQPGYRPRGERGNPLRFKDHFIFDPSRPYPSLSKRTREHLRRAAKDFEFGVAGSRDEALEIVPLYAELKRRRGLAGGFFDFPDAHFETLAALPESVFFQVRGAHGTAGMACGVVFGDWLQVLHIAISDAGLRHDAGYLLMQGMLDVAAKERRLLALGGLPRRGDHGLKRFKLRWSNRTEPVYLLRFVNDGAAYAALARGREHARYFPAYRAEGLGRLGVEPAFGREPIARDKSGTPPSRRTMVT